MILAYVVLISSSMVSIGLTAHNPTYEDTKSPALKGIMMSAMLITMLSLQSFMFVDMFFGMVLNIDIFTFLETLYGTIGMRVIIMMIGPMVLFPIGVVMMWLGTRVLSRPYT